MNKNANSADVRRLTRATRKAGKSLPLPGKKHIPLASMDCLGGISSSALGSWKAVWKQSLPVWNYKQTIYVNNQFLECKQINKQTFQCCVWIPLLEEYHFILFHLWIIIPAMLIRISVWQSGIFKKILHTISIHSVFLSLTVTNSTLYWLSTSNYYRSCLVLLEGQMFLKGS